MQVPKLGTDNLRTSDGRKTPNSVGSLRRVENFVHQERYFQTAGKLSTYLIMQLDFMDVVIEDQHPDYLSFLAKTVQKIKDIDGTFVQSKICCVDSKYEKILQELVDSKEIEIKDGIIFSKRGAPKNIPNSGEVFSTNNNRGSTSSPKVEKKKGSNIVVRERRISFASTKFFDGDRLLNVSRLKEMTDLNFLMSLNGYHLPFYENSTIERSMYQHFYGEFLNKLLGKVDLKLENGENLSCAEYGYLVLQECIFQIHMITEYWISMIECMVEIMSIINVQIELTKRGRGTSFVNLKDAFNDESKIFNDFKSRKLLKSVVEDDDTNEVMIAEKHMARIQRYSEALTEAIKLYELGCTAFIQKLEQIRSIGKKQLDAWELLGDLQSPREWEQSRYTSLISFINDVIIYIRQFEVFLKDVEKEDGLYKMNLESGLGFLKELEEMSKSPRSPMSDRTGYNTNGKKSILSKVSGLVKYYNPWK